MCVHPVLITNRNYGQKLNKFTALKDVVSSKMYVPCGHCPQCVARKQNDIAQRVSMEAENNHVIFFTLTYDNKHLPKITIGEKTFVYADSAHISGMFKRIRRADNLFGRRIRYYVNSEFGSRRGRPHWHGLLFVEKLEGDTPEFINLLEARAYEEIKREWRINVALNKNGKPNTRNPKYEPLYTHVEKFVDGKLNTNFDCHYVRTSADKNVNDVSYYVSKYIAKSCSWNNNYFSQLKEVCTNLGYDDQELRDFWRVIRPHSVRSLHFGLPGETTPFGDFIPDEEIKNRILEGIDFAVKNDLKGPVYFDPITAKQLPLAKYYAQKFLTYDDLFHFRGHLIDPDYGCILSNDATEKQEERNTACMRSKFARIHQTLMENYPDNFTIVDDDNLSSDPLILFDF